MNRVFHGGMKMKKYFASFEGISKGYNGWFIYYGKLSETTIKGFYRCNGKLIEKSECFDTLIDCVNSVAEIRKSGIYKLIEVA